MSKRILIVDDDAQLAALLARRCESLGLNVITAHSGVDALEHIDDRRPDLVCLDINMPTGNGLSVCHMMSRDSRWSGIPVIMLTGRTDRYTVQLCCDLLAYYVPKGYDVWARLEPLICELLGLPRPEPQTGTRPEVKSAASASQASATA